MFAVMTWWSVLNGAVLLLASIIDALVNIWSIWFPKLWVGILSGKAPLSPICCRYLDIVFTRRLKSPQTSICP